METIIKKYYPDYTQEEIDFIIQDFNNCKDTICPNCESLISEDDLEYTGRSWGDGYNDPVEHEMCCPNCGEVEPELIKMDLEQFLSIEI